MKSNKERTVKITYLNEESNLDNFINDFAELIATAIYNKKRKEAETKWQEHIQKEETNIDYNI